MREVGGKAEPSPELVDERRGDAQVVDLVDVPTLMADEMNVPCLARVVISHRSMVEVRVTDEAELLEEIECAIDGTPIHLRVAPSHLLVEVLGRDVARRALDQFDDQSTLTSEPISSLPKSR